ncbi:sigma-54-dependent Fis family transcriptional regulator [bacterium]|nr:sigma-54-dependent Fis family transcriptional regulator [bacterium]
MTAQILVVDDDRSMRDSVARTLERKKYSVLQAPDAASALQILSEKEIDIVISDIRMPGLSGHDLLREVKRRNPETEVILLTAFATVESALEAMKDGAFDYMTKPIPGGPEAVVMTVAKALERRDLRSANRRLTEELEEKYGFENIIGKSAVMRKIFGIVEEVAPTDVTALITGESGTGKELVARAIHFRSNRKDNPFVVVDCGSIPGTLLESELFGFERGAFTGAVRSHRGKLETADRGTVFLDEIGNMEMSLQAKLLRFLQEHTFSRLGDEKETRVDLRVIAATNRDLSADVKNGKFREDLFFRLSVVPIRMPPLRDRREDIPLLISRLARKFFEELRVQEKPFSDEVIRRCMTYDWPGNVRELENVLKYMIALSQRATEISGDHLPASLGSPKSAPAPDGPGVAEDTLSLEEVEKRHILTVLNAEKWNISRSAAVLGINRTTLYKKMEKYGFDTSPGESAPGE